MDCEAAVSAAKRRRPGEFALIAKYFQPLTNGTEGAFGLLDDAARYRPAAGSEMVLTLDTIVADVHFGAADPPESLARKALRVNLSDLAAKGAEPVGYLLSLALPDDWTEKWIGRFARGLAADQRKYGVALLGGDTTRASGGLTITVTALGEVPKGKMVMRSGARPGDVIFVSGTIGDAALAIAVRRGDIRPSDRKTAARLEERYLHPRPRVALAPVLRRWANSAMDVSDGLVGDLAHICQVSAVGAEIAAANVPLSSAAKALATGSDAVLKTVLTGGDDYEILATISPGKAERFRRDATAVGVRVSRLGKIVDHRRHAPMVIDRDGRPIAFDGQGHTHF
jgi:thiamine-monophosphate kinase